MSRSATFVAAAARSGDDLGSLGLRFSSMGLRASSSSKGYDCGSGLAHEYYDRGMQFYCRADRASAHPWLLRAAELGHLDAQYRVGLLLYTEDPRAGLRWLQKAAAAGHRAALVRTAAPSPQYEAFAFDPAAPS